MTDESVSCSNENHFQSGQTFLMFHSSFPIKIKSRLKHKT